MRNRIILNPLSIYMSYLFWLPIRLIQYVMPSRYSSRLMLSLYNPSNTRPPKSDTHMIKTRHTGVH